MAWGTTFAGNRHLGSNRKTITRLRMSYPKERLCVHVGQGLSDPSDEVQGQRLRLAVESQSRDEFDAGQSEDDLEPLGLDDPGHVSEVHKHVKICVFAQFAGKAGEERARDGIEERPGPAGIDLRQSFRQGIIVSSGFSPLTM